MPVSSAVEYLGSIPSTGPLRRMGATSHSDGRAPVSGSLFGGCDTAYASSIQYLGSALYGSLAHDRGSFVCRTSKTPRRLSTWDPKSRIAQPATLSSSGGVLMAGPHACLLRGGRAMPNLTWPLRRIGVTSLVRILSGPRSGRPAWHAGRYMASSVQYLGQTFTVGLCDRVGLLRLLSE